MSRVFADTSLLTWEVFPSGGPFGLPAPARVIFQCLSDPGRRARYVDHDSDAASAEQAVQTLLDEDLRRLLASSRELD